MGWWGGFPGVSVSQNVYPLNMCGHLQLREADEKKVTTMQKVHRLGGCGGWGPSLCPCDQLPGGADATGPRPTLGVARGWSTVQRQTRPASPCPQRLHCPPTPSMLAELSRQVALSRGPRPLFVFHEADAFQESRRVTGRAPSPRAYLAFRPGSGELPRGPQSCWPSWHRVPGGAGCVDVHQ